MSRVARRPVELPKGVEVSQAQGTLKVKGPKGELMMPLSRTLELTVGDGSAQIKATASTKKARAMAGTTRALLANMVTGVSKGFERRLELVGVGYRAQAQGKQLSLTLGFSHPVAFPAPDGITMETPSQTEVIIKGIDKQKVGQVAAEIRRFRPPEPYKGKGVRYQGEQVVMKEAKKK